MNLTGELSYGRDLKAAGSRSRMSPSRTPMPSQPNPIRTVVLAAIGIACCFLLGWDMMRRSSYHFTPGSGIGYALGLVGGVMMLILIAYPLRKKWQFMQRWGQLRYWFWLHMVFGVLGPVLVIYHTGFHVGSLNAAVALVCMLIVALSGVTGRFIYRHIHHGLYGGKATLAELQAVFASAEVSVHRIPDLVPRIEPTLQAFARAATGQLDSRLARLWRFLTLGYQATRIHRTCVKELRGLLRQHAAVMNEEQLRRHRREAQALIEAYLEQAQRVAQFQTYERLFSAWHVLHIPLVYMLFISAVIHVLAVHMY
jgi:hypothetical protein